MVAVPVNSRLHRNEIGYIFDDAAVKVAFTDPGRAESVAPLIDDCEALRRVIVTGSAEWHTLGQSEHIDLCHRAPTDHAWIFYTSGTTGRPKGACLTHRNLLMASLSYYADIDPISPGDTVLHAAPLSHGSGVYGLPHVAKAANSVICESGHFDPGEIAEALMKWRNVSFFAAPTMIVRLVGHDRFAASDHTNLKTIIYGGAPMYTADLLRAIDLLGPRFAQIYGQAESPMTITALPKAAHADRSHPRYLERLASVGFPRTDVEVRTVDEHDNDMPAGEAGEVVVRGDVVMSGYLNNEKATAETLRGGWLHTGDVGSFDESGYLTLRDRVKDVIISGGTNIYPREVEEVLLQHSAVKEVSVVGAPDPEWGEIVVAVVVGREESSLDPKDLDDLCLRSIARFKRPKRYVFVDELPKNNYGKVLKTELRKKIV
jgi:long-chain acyl-CoA synthetase